MKNLVLIFAAILLSACGKSESTDAEKRYTEHKKATEDRFANGAYIAKEKQLSPTETLRLVIVPSRVDDFLDARCLIYTNAEYKVAQMQCPNISTTDLDE